MNTLYQLLGIVGAGLIVWFMYRAIKGQPNQFTRENITKSFSTMGVLAIILIVFVSLLVFMVRST